MDVTRPRLKLAVALALAVWTAAVYAPVRHFEFVNYDDYLYVVDNARIAHGLSWDNVRWSLTAFENSNWHPLTLLSHMLDVQVFGLAPSGHHEVNLAFHALNVILLFGLLAGTTLRLWPSAFVAGLFAAHPLNVQTVAWISERKSLLSTTFWLLALIAYATYRKTPDAKKYLVVLLLAALALAAKPMAVTLPLTFVLLDTWPLETRTSDRPSSLRGDLPLLAPFVVLSLVCGVLTLLAQRATSALQSVEAYSWPVRLGNAVVAYAWYLKAMVWPAGLAAFYPHPMTTLTMAAMVSSATVLLVLSAVVVAKRREAPVLAMGWWWYVGTLAPVVGIIQVGVQAYADRYAYVPLIGVFIMIVWSIVRLTEGRPIVWRRVAIVAGVAWIAALTVVTRAQLPYWHDSASLFQRAIDVVPDNALAHNNLGMALVAENRMPEALAHFQKAVEIAPLDTDAWSNVGNALRALKRPAEAVVAYETALEQAPNDASIHYNLATALIDLRRLDEAATQLREALRLDPSHRGAADLLRGIEGEGR